MMFEDLILPRVFIMVFRLQILCNMVPGNLILYGNMYNHFLLSIPLSLFLSNATCGPTFWQLAGFL